MPTSISRSIDGKYKKTSDLLLYHYFALLISRNVIKDNATLCRIVIPVVWKIELVQQRITSI